MYACWLSYMQSCCLYCFETEGVYTRLNESTRSSEGVTGIITTIIMLDLPAPERVGILVYIDVDECDKESDKEYNKKYSLLLTFLRQFLFAFLSSPLVYSCPTGAS